MGGRPARTYVSGDTFRAISILFGKSPNQRTAAGWLFFPSMTSGTSVIPNQLMTAAIFGIGGNTHATAPRAGAAAPAQSAGDTAFSGIIPIASARWPPADSPVTTIRFTSTL